MATTPASQQQFCVRWNSHLGSLGAAFPQLLAGQRFVDVTLACEGHQLHCHRLVLAACSSYFETLLSENPCKHPIIIMPRDIKLWEIQALVDFMYKGEVNVSQAGLPDLIRCAEFLRIRGLCGSDAALHLKEKDLSNAACTNSSSGSPSHSITAAVSTAAATPTSSNTTTTPIASTPTPAPASSVNTNNIAVEPKPSTSQINSNSSCVSPNSQNTSHIASNANGKKRSAASLDASNICTPNTNKNVNNCKQQRCVTSTPNETLNSSFYSSASNVTPKVEIIDVFVDEDDEIENSNMDLKDISKAEGEEPDYMEGSGKQTDEKQLHHPTQTQQHLIENLEEQIDDAYRQDNENYKRNIYKNLKTNQNRPPIIVDHDYDEDYNNNDGISDDSRLNTPTKKGKTHQEINYQKTQNEISNVGSFLCGPTHSNDKSNPRKRQNSSADNHDTKRMVTTSERSGIDSPISSILSSPVASPLNISNNNNNASATNHNLGKIRVKSDENLYEDYVKINEANNNISDCDEQSQGEINQKLPASLKFNKDEMTIFVKKSDTPTNENSMNQISEYHGPTIHAVRSLASSSISSFAGLNKKKHENSDNIRSDVNSSHSINGAISDCIGRITQTISSASGSSSISSPAASPGISENSNRSISSICYDTPDIGESTTIKSEIVITDDQEQEPRREQDSNCNYENIVCSPNLHDYSNYNNDDEYDEDEDEEVQNQVQKHIMMNIQRNSCDDDLSSYDDDAYTVGLTAEQMVINSEDLSTSTNIPTIIIPTLTSYKPSSQIGGTAPRSITNSNTHIASVSSSSQNVLKNAYLAIYTNSTGKYREVVGPITVGNVNSSVNSAIYYQSASQKKNMEGINGSSNLMEQYNMDRHSQSNLNPSPSAVVLRNPRSNQPRSYDTDSLYRALMDVKHGESIYRASQLHKVPRKTLRNWMKRWDIKSAFPMPRQLQQAAEKKRLNKQMEHKVENYKV